MSGVSTTSIWAGHLCKTGRSPEARWAVTGRGRSFVNDAKNIQKPKVGPSYPGVDVIYILLLLSISSIAFHLTYILA